MNAARRMIVIATSRSQTISSCWRPTFQVKQEKISPNMSCSWYTTSTLSRNCWQESLCLALETSGAYAFALSRDGRFLAHSRDKQNELILEDISGPQPRQLQSTKIRLGGIFHWLSFSPDGRHLACATDESVIVQEVASDASLFKLLNEKHRHLLALPDPNALRESMSAERVADLNALIKHETGYQTEFGLLLAEPLILDRWTRALPEIGAPPSQVGGKGDFQPLTVFKLKPNRLRALNIEKGQGIDRSLIVGGESPLLFQRRSYVKAKDVFVQYRLSESEVAWTTLEDRFENVKAAIADVAKEREAKWNSVKGADGGQSDPVQQFYWLAHVRLMKRDTLKYLKERDENLNPDDEFKKQVLDLGIDLAVYSLEKLPAVQATQVLPWVISKFGDEFKSAVTSLAQPSDAARTLPDLFDNTSIRLAESITVQPVTPVLADRDKDLQKLLEIGDRALPSCDPRAVDYMAILRAVGTEFGWKNGHERGPPEIALYAYYTARGEAPGGELQLYPYESAESAHAGFERRIEEDRQEAAMSGSDPDRINRLTEVSGADEAWECQHDDLVARVGNLLITAYCDRADENTSQSSDEESRKDRDAKYKYMKAIILRLRTGTMRAE